MSMLGINDPYVLLAYVLCILSAMIVGFFATAFWLTFVKEKEAAGIGIVQKFTGETPSILADYPNWPSVDPYSDRTAPLGACGDPGKSDHQGAE